MSNLKRRGFPNPISAVQRLTPNAQAERARLAAARTPSGSNPFAILVGRTFHNPNVDHQPDHTMKGKMKSPDDEPVETNFQPQIKATNVGLSLNNWRRTERPALPKLNPPSNTSDIGLLIAELKAQRDEEQARQDRDKHRVRRKADLEEQTRITSIVTAVSKRFKDNDILQPDGTNLRQWERALCIHASEQFGNPDFFCANKDRVRDESDKQIARGIIHASIHSNLT